MPSWAVGDGVCDCCDGGDEGAAAKCPRSCAVWHDPLPLLSLPEKAQALAAGAAGAAGGVAAAEPKHSAEKVAAAFAHGADSNQLMAKARAAKGR